MARHTFNFDGGEYLTTIGAAWFVSYLYHKEINSAHVNWMKVSTWKNRIGTFQNAKKYHDFWLSRVLEMKEKNLDKNELDLRGFEIKQMAKTIIKKRSALSTAGENRK